MEQHAFLEPAPPCADVCLVDQANWEQRWSEGEHSLEVAKEALSSLAIDSLLRNVSWEVQFRQAGLEEVSPLYSLASNPRRSLVERVQACAALWAGWRDQRSREVLSRLLDGLEGRVVVDLAASVDRFAPDIAKEILAKAKGAGHPDLRAPRILFVCGDDPAPSGGVLACYRQVRWLAEAGIDASVLHSQLGFRARGMPDAPVRWMADTVLDPTRDLLVLPEYMGRLAPRFAPGVAKVIFNQNCFYTFRTFELEEDAGVSALRHPDLMGVVTVSEYSRAYLAWAYPDLEIQRIRLSPDYELFQPGPAPERAIAVMPRKGKDDLLEALNLLRARGVLEQWEVRVIDGLDHPSVARELRRCAIFVASGIHEGLGLASLEAMASGCVVVGYDGFSGEEFFDPSVAIRVPAGDVLSLARRLEEVIMRWDGGDREIAEMGERAARWVRERYPTAAERTDAVEVWGGLLRRALDAHNALAVQRG